MWAFPFRTLEKMKSNWPSILFESFFFGELTKSQVNIPLNIYNNIYIYTYYVCIYIYVQNNQWTIRFNMIQHHDISISTSASYLCPRNTWNACPPSRRDVARDVQWRSRWSMNQQRPIDHILLFVFVLYPSKYVILLAYIYIHVYVIYVYKKYV